MKTAHEIFLTVGAPIVHAGLGIPQYGYSGFRAFTEQDIAKIQAAIDRLEGKAPANTHAKSALPSGWSVKVR